MPKTKTKTATKGPRKAEAKPPGKKKESTVPAFQKALPAAPPASQTKRHSTKKERKKVPSARESIDHVPTRTESTTPLEEAPTGAEPAPLPPAASADVTPASPASIASAGAAAEAPKPTSESRLPPPGTMLQRRDRRGQVLSECVVVEGGGVRYAGTVYASLSAAALAAARDRGRMSTSINGWGYWGLTKPTRMDGGRRDPLMLLDAAWVRFRERVNQLLGEDVPEEARGRVLAQVKEHAKTLERLGGSAA